ALGGRVAEPGLAVAEGDRELRRDPFGGGRAAEDVQADQVRIGLFAHADKGLDDAAADFGAEKSRYLDRRGDGGCLRRRDIGDREGDERGDRESQTDLL